MTIPNELTGLFDFFTEEVKELFVYNTICPSCKESVVGVINEKQYERECDCGYTHQLKDTDFIKHLHRPLELDEICKNIEEYKHVYTLGQYISTCGKHDAGGVEGTVGSRYELLEVEEDLPMKMKHLDTGNIICTASPIMNIDETDYGVWITTHYNTYRFDTDALYK